jgi:ribosome recycling factor
MSEDDQKKLADQIQKLTDSTIAEIDAILATKEGEITQV